MPRRLGCSFRRLVTAGSPMLLTLGYSATMLQAAKHALSGNDENALLISLKFYRNSLVSRIWKGKYSVRCPMLSWTNLDNGWMGVPQPERSSLMGNGFCLCVFTGGLHFPGCESSTSLMQTRVFTSISPCSVHFVLAPCLNSVDHWLGWVRW